MEIKRVLERIISTSKTNKGITTQNIFSLNGHNISEKIYNLLLDQRCLYAATNSSFLGGPTGDGEEFYNEIKIIVKQYFPF
ncbi:MAG: hypothetical protein WC755_00075 [Candidatus Woesearchaeota archaeon]|jgi:hypothetical protein